MSDDFNFAYVCGWCADKYPTKSALNKHWLDTPDCNRNRKANNPLQSKYGSAKGIENIPGEGTLRRIRQPDCEHPENLREDLRPSMDSPFVIGYRCGYCYQEVYT